MTLNGTEQILHNFAANGEDGARPGGLIQGSDGELYGTTTFGVTGSNSVGTIFKITVAGAFTELHNFDDAVLHEGKYPGALMQGLDGNFYGTTAYGGSTSTDFNEGGGTLFEMTPTGTVTILHNFGDGSVPGDGTTPAGLIEYGEGIFYGTTAMGGLVGGGTIFRLNTAGKQPQSVNFPAIPPQVAGSEVVLGATASSGLPITYTSSGPVKLKAGVATVTGVGTVRIRASQAGNDLYAPASTLNTFTVSAGPQTIAFPMIPTQVSGTTYTLTATATSGLPVTYSVSGPATLSGNVLSFTGAGTVIVQAGQAGNSSYLAATGVSESFAVLASQTIAFPAIADQLQGAAPFALDATASSGLPVTYTSTGPVKISGGVATLTGLGKVRIRASQSGNANYQGASVVQTFNVTAAGG